MKKNEQFHLFPSVLLPPIAVKANNWQLSSTSLSAPKSPCHLPSSPNKVCVPSCQNRRYNRKHSNEPTRSFACGPNNAVLTTTRQKMEAIQQRVEVLQNGEMLIFIPEANSSCRHQTNSEDCDMKHIFAICSQNGQQEGETAAMMDVEKQNHIKPNSLIQHLPITAAHFQPSHNDMIPTGHTGKKLLVRRQAFSKASFVPFKDPINEEYLQTFEPSKNRTKMEQLPIRRTGMLKIDKEEKARVRRNAVCFETESDTAKKERQFLRVLRKRF